MLDEIKLMTRGEGNKDFVWFVSEKMDESWRDKYKTAFFQTDSHVNLFVDIENGNYRIYFDKIMRPWTITRSSTLTQPYVVLAASGKCGSESAKAMFKILTNFFFDKQEEVEKLFAEKITKEFVEQNFSLAKTAEVEKAISEKIEDIVSLLSDVPLFEETGLKDNVFVFDVFKKKKNAFFSELRKITDPSESEGYFSLVVTGKNIVERFLANEFDHSIFSRGLCLTTGTIEGGKPIEKTIRTIVSIELSSCPVKTTYKQGEKFVAGGCVIRITYSNGTTETKAVTDDEISGFDPQKVGTQKLVVTYEGCTTSFEVTVTPFTTEGTASGKRTQELEQKTENKIVQIVYMIRSNPSYRNLLIIMSVIILALLVMVRSCVKRSGNGSEENSPEPTEQQCSPQSPDSCKKYTTDSLKLKADSCKKSTKDTLK